VQRLNGKAMSEGEGGEEEGRDERDLVGARPKALRVPNPIVTLTAIHSLSLGTAAKHRAA
jgi:hypothetical protein